MSDPPYDDDTEIDHEEAESDTGASSAIAAAVTAADPPKRPSAKKREAVLPSVLPSGNNANVFGLAYHPLTEAAFGHVVPCNFGKDANFGNSDYFM